MPLFQSILVPLDGSTYSVQALPLAELFASETQAMVHLAMVHQPAPVWFTPLDLPVDLSTYEAAAWNREYDYLQGVARRFSVNSQLRTRPWLLEGDVPSALDKLVKSENVDLVIMTSHGYGGLTRLWLGSTADKLIRRLNVPVLVIHPVPETSIVPAGIQRILVPLDGSSLSASVLDLAGNVARMFHAEIVLTTIAEPVPSLTLPAPFPVGVTSIPPALLALEEERYTAGEAYLDATRDQLRSEGFRAESQMLSGRKAATQIVELARRERCDLIMMATHGTGGLDRALLGSVADRVVRRATVPVLVVRPSATVPSRAPRIEDRAELVGSGHFSSVG